jgi:hypothetical protein
MPCQVLTVRYYLPILLPDPVWAAKYTPGKSLQE